MTDQPRESGGRDDGTDGVLAAARARADALAAGDASALTALLHPEFRWTTHTGAELDRDAYVAANTGGRTVWRQQDLGDPEVLVVGDAAVLRTVVTDVVESPTARRPSGCR